VFVLSAQKVKNHRSEIGVNWCEILNPRSDLISATYDVQREFDSYIFPSRAYLVGAGADPRGRCPLDDKMHVFRLIA